MRKLITFLALGLLLVNAANAQKKSKKDDNAANSAKAEKQAKKEEEKKLREELKGYQKNLEGYKHHKEEIQATSDSDQSQIHDLRAQLVTCSSKESDLETRVNEQDGQLQTLKQQNEALTVKATNSDQVQTPQQGTIYKVQLGMYHAFNINKDFEQPRTIGYEEVDGMNRYVIGYFTDSDMAMDFVKDIRRLGVRDAFVAKYIDGTRVFEWNENPKYRGRKVPQTLQEALEMNNKPGRKK